MIAVAVELPTVLWTIGALYGVIIGTISLYRRAGRLLAVNTLINHPEQQAPGMNLVRGGPRDWLALASVITTGIRLLVMLSFFSLGVVVIFSNNLRFIQDTVQIVFIAAVYLLALQEYMSVFFEGKIERSLSEVERGPKTG